MKAGVFHVKHLEACSEAVMAIAAKGEPLSASKNKQTQFKLNPQHSERICLGGIGLKLYRKALNVHLKFHVKL